MTAGPPAQRWVFTFGPDHTLRIGASHDGSVAGTGLSLAGRYVTVTAADREAARAKFAGAFGPNWAAEYDGADLATAKMIEFYDLAELEVPWPS